MAFKNKKEGLPNGTFIWVTNIRISAEIYLWACELFYLVGGAALTQTDYDLFVTRPEDIKHYPPLGEALLTSFYLPVGPNPTTRNKHNTQLHRDKHYIFLTSGLALPKHSHEFHSTNKRLRLIKEAVLPVRLRGKRKLRVKWDCTRTRPKDPNRQTRVQTKLRSRASISTPVHLRPNQNPKNKNKDNETQTLSVVAVLFGHRCGVTGVSQYFQSLHFNGIKTVTFRKWRVTLPLLVP